MSHQEKLAELEEKDDFEVILEKSGCSQFHYALQDCYFEHKDWRKCQKEMEAFKKCVNQQQQNKQKPAT